MFKGLIVLASMFFVSTGFAIQPALQVSLGSSVAKANVFQAGSVNTAAKTHTNITTYTVSAGKTFYVSYMEVEGVLNTASATASSLGQCSLEIPSGTTVATFQLSNPTNGAVDRVVFSPAEPFYARAGQVVAVSCDPSSTSSTYWRTNFGGFEK